MGGFGFPGEGDRMFKSTGMLSLDGSLAFCSESETGEGNDELHF